MFVLLLVALVGLSPSFAHHEPILPSHFERLDTYNTRITLDHHGMRPVAVWFRSDSNIPLEFFRISDTEWITLLSSYLLIGYANRDFSVDVLYDNGYRRRVLYDFSEGVVEDAFDPVILDVDWIAVKADYIRRIVRRTMKEDTSRHPAE